MKYCVALVALFFLISCVPDPVPEEEQKAMTSVLDEASGEVLYQNYCMECHSNPGTKAPALAALKRRSLSSIVFALENGKMKTQASVFSLQQKIKLAEFISDGQAPYKPQSSQFCDNTSIVFEKNYASHRGFDDRNTAAVSSDVSQLNSDNVNRLELRWAFELPNTSDTRSQPVISGTTIFVAAQGGDIFALDRRTGCIKWHVKSSASVRTSLTLHFLPSTKASTVDKPLIFFGDSENYLNALDAKTGELIWRIDTAISEYSMLTGAVTAAVDRETGESFLIVPVSLYEVVVATDDDHECCKAHGAIHRVDVASGEIIWTTHMTPAATPRKLSKKGVQLWGPSGVPVWSTPTIDIDRGLVYIGTGENASLPATQLSDSIVALSLLTGDVVWHFQGMAGDTWNAACSMYPKGANCPAREGPDYDFGASVILTKNSDGKDILLAGQKSGDIFALDPDAKGELIWRSRVGTGSAVGGVHWGMATAANILLAAANDPPFPGNIRRPGLYAIDIDTGKSLWQLEKERSCETNLELYFQRTEMYPSCSYFFAYSAALSIANDIVFAPALDGRVNVFNIESGELLWGYETAREFKTVTGSTAHGGSMDNVGVVFAEDSVYMLSGYSLFGQLPGNVMLAFTLKN